MNITEHMDEQLKIDDDKYALEMFSAMPKPIQRYIKRLLLEGVELREHILNQQQENNELHNHIQIAKHLAEYRGQGRDHYMMECERLQILVDRYKPDPNSRLSMLSWNELYQAYQEREKETVELYQAWIRDLEQQINEMRDEYDQLSIYYQHLQKTHQEDQKQIDQMKRVTTNQADTISALLTRIEELRG